MTVNEAVVLLRKHLQKTQQIFATELGMSISGLQNYERDRTPEPRALMVLFNAAWDAGRMDLADVFEDAVRIVLSPSAKLSPKSAARIAMKAKRLLRQEEGHPQSADDEFEGQAVATVLTSLRKQTSGASAIVQAIAAAIPDRKRAAWFRTEAVRRGLRAPAAKKEVQSRAPDARKRPARKQRVSA